MEVLQLSRLDVAHSCSFLKSITKYKEKSISKTKQKYIFSANANIVLLSDIGQSDSAQRKSVALPSTAS